MRFRAYIENAGIKVWLDDDRDPENPTIQETFPIAKAGPWTWVKTAPEAIELLQTGNVTYISLDHDLGDSPGVGDGSQVVRFIQGGAMDGSLPELDYDVHSKNSDGSASMELGMGVAKQLWAGTHHSQQQR